MADCKHSKEHSSGLCSQTLAEMVTEKPARARIFEKYNLDYCCGGKRSLAEACAELGISADEVKKALADVREEALEHDSIDLSKASITELCDHIVNVHHAFMKSELPRLTALLEKVTKKHGEKHAELKELQSTFLAMKSEMQDHTKKEEEILFPMCKVLEQSNTLPTFHCGSISNPVRVMEMEHDLTAVQLKKIKALTNNFQPPADACPSFIALIDGLANMEQDLHLHMHKENNILHPRIRAKESQLSVNT